MNKEAFIVKAVPAAVASGHIWPLFAVCEAALESAWGESTLAREALNLFGQKQGGSTEGYATIELPTHEFLNGAWVTVHATWPKFPSWEASFRARMELLNRLPALYGVALGAATGDEFVREVSKHWATDPQRADNVLAIYRANWNDLQNASIMAHKQV